MIKDCCLFICKDQNGNIIGTSGWKNENVRHMYITPKWMGRGIGKKLLEHAEENYMRRTKKSTLYAGVIIYAKGFYEKNGFVVIKQDLAWDGSKYYLMKKEL